MKLKDSTAWKQGLEKFKQSGNYHDFYMAMRSLDAFLEKWSDVIYLVGEEEDRNQPRFWPSIEISLGKYFSKDIENKIWEFSDQTNNNIQFYIRTGQDSWGLISIAKNFKAK